MTHYKFNPFVTPKLIFTNIDRLSNGFALPLLTVTCSRDGNWIRATQFEKSGKSKDISFRTPDLTEDFITKLAEIHPQIKNHLI